ncbi:amino acid adenylation domain-containing protein [Actinoplanes sp. NPDC051475]|uniref:non-ribosomal peptide synthetase n=1 Tax=Actinoplanes sp. NPDC051475 TaxID=3157225 RepID=UPI00344F27C1
MTTQHLASVQQSERAGGHLASVTVTLPSDVDETRARAAAEQLVGRHELLHSRLIKASDGRTVQEALDGAALVWQPGEDPEFGTEARLAGSPLRVQLSTGPQAPGQARIRLTLPSTYADAGALLVLARELPLLAAGRDLPDPVQNSQYAAWQAEEASDGTGAAVLPPAGPRDSADEADVPDEPHHGLTARMQGAPWAAVVSRAQELGCGTGALLLAAWEIVRARRGLDRRTCVYLDHRDVYPDLADSVGVLSWYLPLGTDLVDDDPVRDAVGRVGKDVQQLTAALDSFRWRDAARDAYASDSRAPRRPVLFAAHPVPADVLAADPELIEPSHRPRLSVHVLHHAEAARIDVLHHPGLVSDAEAAALLDSFLAVINGVAEDPDRPIADLPLLTAAARRRVLDDFGHAPERLERPEGTAYDRIAAQAERTPERVAVVDGEREWTYAELLQRAGCVAAAITAAGARPGARIALLLDRSADMVAAVLGTWRAGMCYVPVDPGTPAERLGFMLADSGASLLVTDLTGQSRPDAGEVAVLDLAAVGACAPVTGPQDETEPAYVIYTSGTTGRPKGVMVEHRSLVNLALAHQVRIYGHHAATGAGLRASLNAPLAFDGAAERIMLLARGDTLFVVDDETRRDPEAFVGFARRHRLDVLDGTPAFINAVLQAGLLADGAHQPRVILVGGEAIGPALWQTMSASTVAFYNVYGPTEATVNAAVGRVTGARPHLGHALPNVRLYVLDRRQRPVPVGMPGEIHVAGAGVSRGYLHRPELTARAFLTNPFAPEDPVYRRMYATGDLGRFRPDGTIEFLGRTDGQIKLRGYRIETGELQTLLTEEPGVQDALVRLAGDDPATQSLVAYVVAATAEHAGLGHRLRARLTDRVPAYMVPARFVALAEWPLTRNGKIDVAALPAADGEVPTQEYVAPQGPVETAVARVWSEVLQCDRVSATAGFFEVGGHSLLVPVLMRRLSDEFGVALPIRTIFSARTVTAMAAKISEDLPAQ